MHDLPNTLRKLIEADAEVLWSCSDCTASGVVNLEPLVELLGEDGSLWDRRPPCPRAIAGRKDCIGQVRFYMTGPYRKFDSADAFLIGLPPQAWMGSWGGLHEWPGLARWRASAPRMNPLAIGVYELCRPPLPRSTQRS